MNAAQCLEFDFVTRFCAHDKLSPQDLTFAKNHNLIFVNGGGWALTEYARNLLGSEPSYNSKLFPDDDSYLPQPGRLDFGASVSSQHNLPANQEELNRQVRGVLDIQIGGDHYKKMGHHQPWEVLATWMTPEELRGYMKGTVIAYLARERDKGGDLDIEKVQHTIQLWQQVRKDK